MADFRLESKVPAILQLTFRPFPTRKKDLAVVRYQKTIVGRTCTNPNVVYVDGHLWYNRLSVVTIHAQADYQINAHHFLTALCKLGVIRQDEKDKHLEDVKKEQNRIEIERLATDFYDILENENIMASITTHIEHLNSLLTSDDDDKRRLGSSLQLFKRVLNGEKSWEIKE